MILLCLALSALSIVIAIPFLVLLSSFLLSPTTHTFSVWPATTLIVYTWSLAILRGIQHVVVVSHARSDRARKMLTRLCIAGGCCGGVLF